MATKPVNGGAIPNTNVFAPLSTHSGKASDASEVAKAKAVPPSSFVSPNNTDGRKSDAANVQISTSAKARAEEQKKAFDIAKATPDIREDRVSDIKARIANGSYQIDSGKIADGMLREAVVEHLAEGED